MSTDNNLESKGDQSYFSKCYEEIASSCWSADSKQQNNDNTKEQNRSDIRTSEESIGDKIPDLTKPMSAEDVTKLSQGIADDIIKNGNLNNVEGRTFGYSSAFASAYIESGAKGVKQLVDKINSDLKESGSGMTLSVDDGKFDGKSMDFKLHLQHANGREIDNRDVRTPAFVHRNLDKEQVDKAIPFIAELAKDGSFSNDERARDFLENVFKSAMMNDNLDDVTKKINEALKQAGSPYRVDSHVSKEVKHSDKFGEFDRVSKETVKVSLSDSNNKQVVDSITGTVLGLGVINNRIDPPPRHWPPIDNGERLWPPKLTPLPNPNK